MQTIPDTIQQALKAKVDHFMGDRCEWKLDLSDKPADIIATLAECPVLVFANNGFGDYLFLKSKGNGYESTVFEYFHEGPEIFKVDDELELLLGLRERPASIDPYPHPLYETGDKVQLGDRVEIKVWAQFWKGWQPGEVTYVPGISRKNLKFEYEGLKSVAIRFRDGEICPLVDPATGLLKKVRYIGRKEK